MDPVARAPSRIYLVVGDSHATRFDGIVLEDTGGPIVTKARWLPGLRMSALFQSGRISEYLTLVLREMRFVMRGGNEADSPFPLLQEPNGFDTTETLCYAPRFSERMVLMFAAGAADALDISREYYPNYDIDLPGDSIDLQGAAPYAEWKEQIGADAVASHVRARCEPLFRAVLALRDAGYKHLFLHDLPPPGPVTTRHFPHQSLRFKVIAIFNRVLEEFARANGIGFVSTWDVLFIDRRRVAGYESDEEHLTPESTLPSVIRLHQQMMQREG
ncbi:MAG TPA: hypothetical protein VNF68_07470 [Candidatus Baltobacteraceae bacterium]|nr:hypothetical protein [Candidatus Baltobacteraceae bacterium]